MRKVIFTSLHLYIFTFFVLSEVSAQIKAIDYSPAEMRRTARTFSQPAMKPMTIGSQQTAPLKSIGAPKVPVILVQFEDKQFFEHDSTRVDSDTTHFFDLYLNGEEPGVRYTGAGSYGSVRDYFISQSDSLFQPEFVVIGPVTLSNGYAYYGGNSGNTKDIHISDFYTEAIKLAQQAGTDFTIFDNDSNGTVDMVYFIYAGRGENDSKNRDENTIWPKENGSGGTIGGVKFGAYACNNEEFRGTVAGIGSMCHELSHALGLPDFYDTKYVAFGLDYWDVMDSGCYLKNQQHPVGYSAYEREFMGWRSLITLPADSGMTVTLYPMTRPEGRGYKVVNKENPDEYYVLENRQPEDWDMYIGYGNQTYGYNQGMLVTHIHYVASRWSANTVNTVADHQLCTIIPADSTLDSYMYVGTDYNLQEYLASARGDIYPGETSKTDLQGSKAFVFTTTGDTPGEMGQPITGITQNENGSVTFQFCGGEPDRIESISFVANSQQPAANSQFYDITGRRISDQSGPSGLYINNGKKYFRKQPINP